MTADPKVTPEPEAQKAPEKRRPRRIRRFLKWTSAVLVLVVLLAVGLASGVLWTSFGTRVAVEEALGFVNDAVPGKVRVGTVEGSLVEGLVLRDVVIDDPDGGEALRLERLELRVGLRDLVSKRVGVDELTLSGLDLSLFDSRRRMGLARAFVVDSVAPKEAGEPSDWIVDVKRLRLEHVRVVTFQGGPTVVRDLAIDGELHYDRDVMRWSGLKITGDIVDPPDRHIPKGNFQLTSEGSLEGEHLAVSRLTVEAGGARLDISGDVPSLAGKTGTLELHEVSTDLAALSKLLGLPALLGNGSVTGQLRSDGHTVFARLETHAGDSSLRIGARMGIDGPGGSWDLQVDGSSLAPQAIVPGLPAVSVDSLKVRASGGGTPMSDGRAEFTLAAQGIAMAGVPLQEVEADGSLEGPAAGLRFTARGSEFGVIHGSVKMADVRDSGLTATVRLKDIDLASLSAVTGLSALRGITGKIPELQIFAEATLNQSGPPTVSAAVAGTVTQLTLPPAMGGAHVASLSVDTALAWPGRGLPTGKVNLVLGAAAASGLAGENTTLQLEATEAGTEIRVVANGRSSGLTGPGGLSVGNTLVGADARLSATGVLSAAKVTVAAEALAQGPWHLAEINLATELQHRPEGAVFTGPLRLSSAVGPGGLSVASIEGDLSASLGQRLTRPNLPVGAKEVEPLGARTSLRINDIQLGPGGSLPHLEAELQAKFDAAGLGGQLVLRGTSPRFAGFALDDVSLDARLDPDKRGRLEVRARRGRFSAGADVGLAFTGSLAGALDLSLSKLFVKSGTVGLESLGVAKVHYDPLGHVGLEALKLRLLAASGAQATASTLDVDGRFALASKELALDLMMPKQRIERWVALARAFGGEGVTLPEMAGELGIEANLHGTPARLRGNANVTLADATIGTTRGISADVDVTLTGADAQAKLAVAWGPLHINGAFKSPWPVREGGRTELTLSTSELPLTQLRAFLPATVTLDGAAQFEARLAGAWPRIEGTASVRGTKISMPQLEPLDLSLDLSLEAGRLGATLKAGPADRLSAHFELPIDLATISGGLNKARLMDTPVTGRIDLASAKLKQWTSAASKSVANLRVSAGLDVVGPLRALALTGEIKAEGGLLKKRQAVISLATVNDAARVRTAINASGRELANALLTLPVSLGAAAMRPNPLALLEDPACTLAIGPVDLDLDGLEAIAPGLGKSMANLVSSPRVRGSFAFHGDAGGPIGSGTIELDSIKRGAAGSAIARAAAARAAAARATRGAADAAPPGPPPAAVSGGIISGASLRVALGLDSVSVQLLATPTGTATAGGATAGGATAGGALDLLIEAGLGSRVVLGAGMSDLKGIGLGGHVRVKDLAVDGLAAFAPALLGASQGAVNVDLEVGGTIGHPRLMGRASAGLQRLVVGPLGLDQPDVMLGVSFDEDSIHVGPMRVTQGDGTLDVDLTAKFGSFAVRDIALAGAIAFDRYRMLGRNDLMATLSGTVELNGKLGKLGVVSHLRLDEVVLKPETGGRDVVPVGPPDGVVYLDETNRARKKDTAALVAGILRGLNLDLTVEIPSRSVRVRNDMVDLQASGDLKITSHDSQLAIAGQIGVDEGRVFVYGREFALTPDSRVFFDGSDKLEPTLDVRATFDISGVDLTPVGPDLVGKEITLSVSGSTSRPRVRLRSDPEMTETYIMSIITLGFPAGGGQGGQEDKGKIANLVMGLVSASASRMLQDKLPVDVFKMETGGSQLSKTKITVGRRILRNLMVMYHADLGAREGENTNEVRLQYELSQRLHLDGRYGDGQAGAMDLFYRWRF